MNLRFTCWVAAAACWLAAAGAAQGAGAQLMATVTAGGMTLQVRVDADENFVGRFNLGHATAGPLISCYPLPPSHGFTTVRVNGVDRRFGDQASGQVTPQASIPDGLRTLWTGGGVEVRQDLTVGTYARAGVALSGLEMRYQVTNQASTAALVGLRLMLDVRLGAREKGAICASPGGPPVGVETGYWGGGMPSLLWLHDAWPDPARTAILVARAGEVSPLPDGLVIADYLWNGPKAGLERTLWEHPVTGLRMADTAAAIYWNPQVLAAGRSRTYLAYLGLPVAPPPTGPTPGSEPFARGGTGSRELGNVRMWDRGSLGRSVRLSEAGAAGPKEKAAASASGRARAVAYPNPARGVVYEKVAGVAAGRTVQVQVYDVTGRPVGGASAVADEGARGAEVPVSLERVPAGVYFWVARAGGERLGGGKIAVVGSAGRETR